MTILRTVLVVTLMVVTASVAPATDLCRADKNGDGVVGASDLTLLLAAWGGSDPDCDFNADGLVGCFDLEYLIGNWGPCPTCLGDLDQDGLVGINDLNILLSNAGNDCRMDLNQNGTVDPDDVDAFLCLFGTPGPLGDFDGNGGVGASDLTIMLAAVGRDCRGDLNQDGVIDKSDVNILTTNWGSC